MYRSIGRALLSALLLAATRVRPQGRPALMRFSTGTP